MKRFKELTHDIQNKQGYEPYEPHGQTWLNPILEFHF